MPIMGTCSKCGGETSDGGCLGCQWTELEKKQAAIANMVKFILDKHALFQWSVHGIGMLRLYLPNNTRLHVWDQRLRTVGVSDIHTHPWSFRSTVVSGKVLQQRFAEERAADLPAGTGAGMFLRSRIRTGDAAAENRDPEQLVCLVPGPVEVYGPGDSYEQLYNEIHRSFPVNGTVTYIERTMAEDADHACIYWPNGEEWVDAKPRSASMCEVNDVIELALGAWNA